MEGRFETGYVTSSVIISFYNELLGYTLRDMKDSDEYNACLDKIRKMIVMEDNEYNKLNLKQVNYYIRRLNKSHMHTPVDDRYIEKLTNRRRILSGEAVIDGDILLSTIFDSKIIIDTFKSVFYRIEEFDADDEFKSQLMELFNTSLFYFFTSNNFLERNALENGFDVLKLPNINYEKIGDYVISENSKNTFKRYIDEALTFLDMLSGDNDIMLTYVALLEISRIEIMLQYVSAPEIEQILDKLNKYKTNEALDTVKRLVLKKKEEMK